MSSGIWNLSKALVSDFEEPESRSRTPTRTQATGDTGVITFYSSKGEWQKKQPATKRLL
jgi:hypothetical protein